MSDKKVVTRFAPSPTGFMHVGNVRTALYAWLWARKNNGIFILRIEDTDKKREVEGSIEHIKKSLKWLNLNWDEGPDIGGPHAPYIQSQRLDIFKKYAEILIKKGFAYADPYTEEKIEKWRQEAESGKKAFLFREHRPENPPEWKLGMPLRFKIKELKRTTWQDAVRGELTAGPEALDDFILIKSDGYPTYNFAHIVDDIEMGVTHVVRGQEFISSTPNYIAVYEALEAKEPIYVTAPPIMGTEGTKKMGKRDGAKDTLEYEREGYLPEAMFNFLVFLGWNPGGEKEIMTRKEIIDLFDISKIQKSGAQFNEEKLNWINKEHMKLLNYEEFYKKADSYLGLDFKNEIMNRKNLDENGYKNFILHFKEKIIKFSELKNIILHSHTKAKQLLTATTGPEGPTGSTGPTEYIKPENINSYTGNTGPNDYLLSSRNPTIREHEIELLISKDLKKDIVVHHLIKIQELLEKNNWEIITKKDNESELWVYAGKEGRGNVLWPLRVALSGVEKSPDPFEIMKIIGKDSSLQRIKNVLDVLGGKNLDIKTENNKKEITFTK